MLHKRTGWSVLMVALAMLVTMVQPAVATDGSGEAVASGVSQGASQQDVSDHVSVTFGDRYIDLTNANQVAVRMKMPADKASERAGEGRYGAGSWSLVARANDTGVVAIIEIADESAPDEYTFEFDLPKGWELSKDPESGAVTVLNENDESVGSIAPPWAVDANGNELATSFVVHGKNKLVQTVEHEGAAYPVTADPSVTFGKDIYFWVWGWEIGLAGVASTSYLRWFVCAYSAGTLCGVAWAAATALRVAFVQAYWGDSCRYVLAWRYWLWPDYVERLNTNGCSYYKVDIPG